MDLTTLALVKSETFLNIAGSDFDAELAEVITSVSDQVIVYCSSATVDGWTSIGDVPAGVQRAVAKQVSYEWRRRKDPGLTSVTFPDSTVNKFDDSEFLASVRDIIDRYRSFEL